MEEDVLIQDSVRLISYPKLHFPWIPRGSTPGSRRLGLGCSRDKIGNENRGECK